MRNINIQTVKKYSGMVLTITVLSFMFTFSAFAESTDIYKEIPRIIEELGNGIPTDNLGIYSEITSKSLMPQNFFFALFENIGGIFRSVRSSLFTLVAIIFVSSAFDIFSSNLGGIGKITNYALHMSMILVCIHMFEPLTDTVSDYLNGFVSFMTAASGTMSVLLSSCGSITAGTGSSASAAFITALTQIFSVNVILPSARTVIALSVVSALSTDTDLSGIISFIRSFSLWGLGALFAIFGGIHSALLAVSAAADNLALRGIRFTAARLIPVAGNMISESMKTVISGINSIKTTAGGLGIVYILYALIPAILPVLSVKLTVLCALFLSKLAASRRYTAFLEGFNSSLNILLGICIFASISGILIFAVFMNTSGII